MKKILLSLVTLVGLIAAPLAAAPSKNNVPISSLPFNITAPGTYVLAGDLTLPPQSSIPSAAITISLPTTGPVIVDLNGHSITGFGFGSDGIAIGGTGGTAVSNTNPITIRNGAIKNVSTGIIANVGFNNGLVLSALTINSIAFSIAPTGQVTYGILFQGVGSSSVNGCTIEGAAIGIVDSGNNGNSYNNITFTATVGTPLEVLIANTATPNGLVLDRCQFTPIVKVK